MPAQPTPTGKPRDPFHFDVPHPALARRQRKKRRGFGTILGVGLVLAILVGAVFALQPDWFLRQLNRGAPLAPTPTAPAVAPPVQQTVQRPYSRDELERSPALMEEFQPTNGQPIELLMMPSGVNLVIHLRPALLWSDEQAFVEFRRSLGDDLVAWIETVLQSHVRFPPQEIDEATFGILLGPIGTEPEVCSLIRRTERATTESLKGKLTDAEFSSAPQAAALQILNEGDRSFLIRDGRTFASFPRALADDVSMWTERPNQEVSQNLLELLQQTDRQRLITVVGLAADARRHVDESIPDEGRMFLGAVLDWLGTGADAVSWSLHPAPDCHMEFRARPVSTATPVQLYLDLNARLSQLSRQLSDEVCPQVSPATQGSEQFIERIPAMAETLVKSAIAVTSNRTVSLTSVLPATATPNLALAARFLTTEFVRRKNGAPAAVASGATPTRSIEDRLQTLVDAEFTRTPLEQAVQFLCEESGFTLAVDGDALKDAGYTRNMPQTMNLGKIPLRDALAKIIGAYQSPGKEMVMVIDAGAGVLTLSTRKFAEEKGETILPLPVP